MANSMIADLLKSPADVRREQLEKLRTAGASTAQAMLTGGGGGSPISGAIRSLAAATQATMPETMAQVGRSGLLSLSGLAQAAGSPEVQESLRLASMSPKEQMAEANKKIMQGVDFTSTGSLKKAIERFSKIGNLKAAEALSSRLMELEDRALKTSVTQQQKQLVANQLDEYKRKATDRVQQRKAITEMLPNIDKAYMPESMKSLIGTLEPGAAIKFVQDAVKAQRDAEKLEKFNQTESRLLGNLQPPEEGGAVSIEQINKAYTAAIKLAKASNLDERAKTLETERKARVDERMKVRDIEEKLRGDFRDDKTSATQREMINKAREGIRFLQTGTGAADIAGIISFMKTLDPGSVVREGEFDTAAGLGSVLSSFKAAFAGWTKGDRLTNVQRNQLIQAMSVASEVAANSYNKHRQTELAAYNGRNYDGAYIVGEALTPIAAETVTDEKPLDEEGIKEIGILFQQPPNSL